MSLSKDRRSQKFNGSAAPTVSVIMNCLNCEKYLSEAIDSVFAQTYEDWEIIFWEDKASEDNSERIARSYGSKLRYFRSDVSLPLYGSRNLALQQARGKYIAILDCDDMWLPTKLEEQIPLLERDDAIGLVHSDAFLFSEKGKESRHFDIVKPYRDKVFSELLLNNFINTQTVVVRKKAFDCLERWFDGRLVLSGDYDAFLRISDKWKVDYVDKPLARYRVHRNSKTWRDGRVLLSVELDLVIDNLSKDINGFEKNYPDGIRRLKRRRDVALSLLDWENGDRKKARKRLNAYMQDGVYYLTLSLLMYLPYRYVFHHCRRVYTLYTKNILAP
jgi:glycosyltransferase involved in cell wall biosynthesis